MENDIIVNYIFVCVYILVFHVFGFMLLFTIMSVKAIIDLDILLPIHAVCISLLRLSEVCIDSINEQLVHVWE